MADIAQCQSAEQGIRQRMQSNITIRVGLQSLTVSNADAGQHDMVAGTESMHINALADTQLHDSDSCLCRSR